MGGQNAALCCLETIIFRAYLHIEVRYLIMIHVEADRENDKETDVRTV
jgi:hypothetical protein